MWLVRLLTLVSLLVCVALTLAEARKTQSRNAGRPAAELIDINHATQPQLKTLPGIADAYALAIIRNRPYRNKTQLRSKGIIPYAAYTRIKDRIVARQ